MKTTAYLRDFTAGFFSIAIPSFFSTMQRLEREDLLSEFRSSKGRFDDSTKSWIFPSEVLTKMPTLLKSYEIDLVSQRTQQTKTLVERPVTTIIVEPRKTLVQMPVTLVVGPSDPAVQRILESTYARLEQEFLKLHMETGVCKTKMREILSRAVPAVENPLFAKAG